MVLPCSYYPGPYGIREGHWYKVNVSNGDPKDLRWEPEYRDRVRSPYSETSCDLHMTTLTESDAGIYYFGFKALASPHRETTAWIHGSPGIALVVSGEKSSFELRALVMINMIMIMLIVTCM